MNPKNNSKKASETRSNLLRIISHEIRTPLNGIIGNTELVKVKAKTTEGASIIEAISYSSEHLLSVLNDVLDYSITYLTIPVNWPMREVLNLM